MADNTILNTGTGGDTIATDDIGGVKFQRVKLIYGVDGINSGDVATGNGLPTLDANSAAIKAAVETIDNAISGSEMQVDIVSMPPITGNIATVSTLTNLANLGGSAVSMNTGLRDAGTQRVTIATNDSLTVTPTSITKGTQGSAGFTVQQLKDAGRNARHFMLDAYTAAPVAEALQSVVQWFGNAAVAATTQPSVVTSGKTLRLTNYSISTKSLATVGSVVVRIRANTSGLGTLASPLVFSMECGSRAGATTVAMTGGMDTFSGVFPEGLEFPAGTGLAFSMAGYGPTGTLTLQGVTRFQVFGYEY